MAEAQAASPEEPAAGPGPRPAILVIDDDEEFRSLLVACLQASGYEVQGMADGREAISVLERRPFDLVVTDIFMPHVDGLEVIRAIRRQSEHLPILAVSGGGDERAMAFLPIARLLGANSALAKPFPLERLRSRVQDLLPPC